MAAITITTFSDLLTDLSEKVGETTADTSNNRKRKINNAYYFIANKRLWWWLEATSTDTTTTSLSYSLPTDFRAFHPKNPVKIGNTWRQIVPFMHKQLWDGTTSVVTLPQITKQKKAYIYGTKIYFIQDSMDAGDTITYYYYKKVTALDDTSDEPLIPVEFREMISLYAAGMHLKTQGGRESVEGNDYLELFDVYLKDMETEDDNRRTMGIKRRMRDPEEAAVWEN